MLNRSDHEVAIVVDCGVLTFDVSLIECKQGNYNVIASEVLNNIGGDSFTNVLLLMALQKLGIEYQSLDVHDLYILREAVEAAKIEMSETGNDASLTFKDRTILLSNSEFEKSCYLIIGRCCKEIKEILNTAQEKGITPTTLVLAGRATQLPCFQRALVSTAKIRRAYQNVDASVVLGLAMYSMTESYQADHRTCENCNVFVPFWVKLPLRKLRSAWQKNIKHNAWQNHSKQEKKCFKNLNYGSVIIIGNNVTAKRAIWSGKQRAKSFV